MKNWLLMSACVAISLSVPALAQPVATERPGLSEKAQEQQRSKFAWLLGTWQADHMFGSNSNRSGARITFFLESNGTVSARLDKMSQWMEMDEKRYREVLGRTFIRGINSTGRPRATWTHSASGGSVFNKRTGEWTNLGIIYINRDDGKLSHLGGMSDLANWIKISDSKASSAMQPARTSNNPSGSKKRPTTSSNKSGAAQKEVKRIDRNMDEKRLRCIHIPVYVNSLNKLTNPTINSFTKVTETVAVYDPGLPGAKLYPSPIQSSADIPDFMDAKDFLILEDLEALADEMVNNRGPDNWLKEKTKQIRRLHLVARDRYEGVAKRAADDFKPCPTYAEPLPYSHLEQAEEIMAELRQRRDGILKPILAKGERLNEELNRKLNTELAEANSLEDKAGVWLGKRITETLGKEGIEPRKIEALVPQLDELRDLYQRLEAAGTPVSEKQRDIDLKAALKRSGIDYTPTNGEKIVRGFAVEIGDEAFNAIGAQIIKARAPAILQQASKTLGYISLAKDTAEIINALRNISSLWDVRQELLPTTLAASEDRAYLTGLIQRYDRIEAEYEKLRKQFENSITKTGEMANREW